MTSYTYEYILGKATQAQLRSLTRAAEGVGHKIYTDNFFCSPDIFNDLYRRGINCGTDKIIKECHGALIRRR